MSRGARWPGQPCGQAAGHSKPTSAADVEKTVRSGAGVGDTCMLREVDMHMACSATGGSCICGIQCSETCAVYVCCLIMRGSLLICASLPERPHMHMTPRVAKFEKM